VWRQGAGAGDAATSAHLLPEERFVADFDICINARPSETLSAAALLEYSTPSVTSTAFSFQITRTNRCMRVALHAVRLVCVQFLPQDDGSPSAAAASRVAVSSAVVSPTLYVRISHAALPYIIMQMLELLQMSDKSAFYFNSSLMKAYIADSLANAPASTHDDEEASPPPPPSKRRIAAAEAQLECSGAIAEKVLKLADLRSRNLQTFTASIMRELGLQTLLDDVKSRDPELKTKRAKKLSKLNDLQKIVFDQLGPVDSILPLLQGRVVGAVSGMCHVIFKYDCLLDLPKEGSCKWQGVTFQIAFAPPQSASNPLSVHAWEEVGGGGIYVVTQQSSAAPRGVSKVGRSCAMLCCIVLRLALRSRRGRASAAVTGARRQATANCFERPRCVASA
jgi:hypothetical protein